MAAWFAFSIGVDNRQSGQMKQMDLNDIEALRTFEYGLMIACPLNGDPNPPFCQSHEFRLLPVAERFKRVDAFSDEEVVKHYLAHMNCYYDRMERDGSD
ncbi:MAG: hypothetical protein OQJ84_09130 [Xanthomonadales bacterium]|nr:hypothetical protein [Xanthomonadales bacterium]